MNKMNTDVCSCDCSHALISAECIIVTPANKVK